MKPMHNSTSLPSQIQILREKAGVSQTKLANQLGFTASKISRLETGELNLDSVTAGKIARSIATPDSISFAEYLSFDWTELDQPWFNHPSLEVLQRSERALQRLKLLADDPDVKNSFLKQVASCGNSLLQTARHLQSIEHPVVYIGKPGVGKTTAICSEGQLRNNEEKTLAKQMIFQTGSGRSTVGEVHVRYGSDYAIHVTPCSMADLEQYIKDLADGIIAAAAKNETEKNPNSHVGNSAEVDRLLRNMTGLSKEKQKQGDGTYKVVDPALDFFALFSDREQLITRLWERLDLPKRRRTSITLPHDSTESGFAWVSKTFRAINLGNHPEFLVPERIEVTLPIRIFGCEEYDVTLIDTRGVDEPTAPRRDIQSYLDDERAIIVLCSDFVSAPDATIQSLIERGLKSGCEAVLRQRSSILVVTKDGEDERVFDDMTGEEVGEREIGRAIRREQMKSTTLKDLGLPELPVRFLDVREEEDCDTSRKFVIGQVKQLRVRWESRATLLIDTVDQLIANKANEQMQEAMETAFNPIVEALGTFKTIVDKHGTFHGELITDINGIRYASSLRASVNRRGDWHNFHYWHGLGSGARQAMKSHLSEQITKLRGVIETQVGSYEDQPFGSFLVHFQQLFEQNVKQFFVWVAQVGETAFYEQFHSDDKYWNKAKERWGGGPGYKNDISHWTRDWFEQADPRDRADFLDAEIGLKWNNLIEELQDVLTSSSL